MERQLLIADANEEMRTFVKNCFSQEAFTIVEAASGSEAMELMLQDNRISLVILDVMMIGAVDLEMLKALFKQNDRAFSVILLSGPDDTARVARGLHLGADDYLVKPFDPAELLTRVDSVLRRLQYPVSADGSFQIQDLVIDPKKYMVTYNDQEILLTSKEYKILYRLASNPGRVYSREEILQLEWGMDFAGDSRSVDTHVKNIRTKLASAGCNRNVIETIWGIGYRISEDQ
ncbi:response regulator transcription factor [Salisediminibacterium beveridgei]|uniref:Heme response regulator HssR n=1 Tax=Salisediminibacterium beveridgei TaxID=632773 RepID=A0A1D7QZ24_9BACI|nr:response regulator transcription factor [Salisediminibacterium beveridgei]AOM84248.1 DNA-binding response regulator [Salisediminibacterium beveridgei]